MLLKIEFPEHEQFVQIRNLMIYYLRWVSIFLLKNVCHDIKSVSRPWTNKRPWILIWPLPTKFSKGSGCSSVGRAVAFNSRGPRFDSSHFLEHLFIINCIEKTKINKKRPGMAHFLNNVFHYLLLRFFKNGPSLASNIVYCRPFQANSTIFTTI